MWWAYRWSFPPCHTSAWFPLLLCAICISYNRPNPKLHRWLQRNRIRGGIYEIAFSPTQIQTQENWSLICSLHLTKTTTSTCKDDKNSVDDGEEGPSEAAEKGHAGVDGLQPRDVRYVLYGFIRVGTNQPAQKMHIFGEHTKHTDKRLNITSLWIYTPSLMHHIFLLDRSKH